MRTIQQRTKQRCAPAQMWTVAWTGHARRLLFAYLSALALGFTFCEIAQAADSHAPDRNKRAAVLEDFAHGRVALDCSILCNYRYIFHQKSVWELYDNQRWEDLAYLITTAGWREDITYFLLGQSAENLGYVRAADRYYRIAGALSQEPGAQCAAVADLCAGHDIAGESLAHLEATDAAVAVLVHFRLPSPATVSRANIKPLAAYGLKSNGAPASGHLVATERQHCQSFGRPVNDENHLPILWAVCGDPADLQGIE